MRVLEKRNQMVKALVIDDIEEVAVNFVRMLELLDVEAKIAYSVREAMLFLLEDLPDIIFLDIRMPGFDGFEVLSYLQREPRLEDVPVCIVSSDAQEETIVKAREHGVIGYIIKPPTVDDFETVLREANLLGGS